MRDVMTEHQAAVAARVIAEESERRHHLVVSLCGAHAYGFASADSDLDLKAVHAAPTAALLGLSEVKPSWDRLEVLDGVEVDYTSNELDVALRGVLAGNGNMLERLLDPAPLYAAPELPGLAEVVRKNLSRRVHRHYRGFATQQRRAVEAAEVPRVKKVLYVLRTALTGVHALETGEVIPDLGGLGPAYGFTEVPALIEAKRAAEGGEVPLALRPAIPGLLDRAFARLEEAAARSPLPESPASAEALEAWLLDLRRARW